MKRPEYKRISLFFAALLSIFSLYATNEVKDSLIHALSKAQDVPTRLEVLVNLSDVMSASREMNYNRMLWEEAIAAGDDLSASTGIAKMMGSKLAKREYDSLFYYTNLARKHLKNPLNRAISTYYEMIYESRQLLGSDSEECNRIIEKATNALKERKDMDEFEKMKNLYVIICSIHRVESLGGGASEDLNAQMRHYSLEMLKIARTVPLEMGGSSYIQQALIACSITYNYDSPEYVDNTLEQLKVYEDYLKLPCMQKRPFYSQRSRIQVYGTLASALTLSQSERDYYYNKCMELIEKYPLHAPATSPNHYRATINYSYFLVKGDDAKVLQQIDSILKYSVYHAENVSHYRKKADLLAQQRRHEEAYQSLIKSIQLADSLNTARNSEKHQELQMLYDVNAEKLKNAELQQHNQKLTISGIIIILLLALGWGLYNFSMRKKVQKLNQKIQESETVKSAFLHSMCHEVRTPLNIISGFTSMVLLSEVDEEEKAVMSTEIEQQTNLLTKMLDDMLEVSKLDSSDDLLPTDDADIYQECDYSISKFKQMYADRNWMLKTENTGEILKINRSYFNQLVDNLLSNAAKFSEPDGHTTLTYHIDKDKKQLKVCIADTGMGIPKDKRKWVFERFTKIDEFKQGAGLGLYVCSLIAKRMGGRIYVDDTYSGGTKMVFEVPVELK